MKKIIPLAALSLALATGIHAAPFMAIGDGAELFLTGALSVRADDNIYLTHSATSDVIFDLTPGAEITFGKDAQLKGALTLNLGFSRYSDNDALDTKLANADFVAHYDDGKTKLNFSAGYHELNQNNADVRPTGVVPHLIRRDVSNVGGSGEIELSQLTSLGAGFMYNHENYHPVGYADTDVITVPLDFYYKWTPKIDVSAGYHYRQYDVNLGEDSKDHNFLIGGRGEFSPKLTGTFNLGLGTRRLQRSGTRKLFSLDASFAYDLSEKTSLQFGASNDFGTSPQGAQQKNLTVRGGINTKFNEQWSFNAGASYRRIQYADRSDDYWEGNFGATYFFDRNITLTGGYTYRNYNTPLPGSDFTNNVFSLAANFRY